MDTDTTSDTHESKQSKISDFRNGETRTDSEQSLDTEEKVKTGISNSSEPVIIIEEQEYVEKVPDGGWGWWIVVGSVIMHSLMGGFERSNGIIYQQILDRFGGTATATAWVTSIFSTLRLILGPIASALSTRFSCRSVVMVGGILAMISLLLSGYAMKLEFLYFSYGILGGCGRAMTYTPSLVIVNYYFNKRRGLAVGLATSGVGFGTFLLPPLMELLFYFYGFAGSFLILSSIALHFCVSGALFRPLEKHQQILKNERRMKEKQEKTKIDIDANKQLLNGFTADQTHREEVELLENQSAAKQLTSSIDIISPVKIESRRPSLFKRQWDRVRKSIQGTAEEKKRPFIEFSLLKNFSFLALCLAIMLFTIAFNSTFVFLPSLSSARGITKIQGAYLVSILGICDGLSRIIISFVLDLKKVKPYRLYAYNIIVFLTGAVSLSYPSMRTFPQFMLLSCLYGILSGAYISQKSVVIVDILGVEKLASSFGILLMFQGIGSLIGPPVGGLIKDYVGTYDGAFYVGSAGTFLGGFVLVLGNILRYRQQRRKEKTQEMQEE